jgi:hypothetical protein
MNNDIPHLFNRRTALGLHGGAALFAVTGTATPAFAATGEIPGYPLQLWVVDDDGEGNPADRDDADRRLLEELDTYPGRGDLPVAL